MKTLYENYLALPIDKGLLCLEQENPSGPYFCYPANAQPIGFEGAILYCFLPAYGEMVFACNPESCADTCISSGEEFSGFYSTGFSVRHGQSRRANRLDGSKPL